ncbi:MAG: PTS sugar transporter subunit IIA [Scandinavium sp.]|uniref:PTS sugar transporter subunit IIA n=1 Tax=Scandinavium sp. TaxID=2830653 RepID=UPI003F2CA1C0
MSSAISDVISPSLITLNAVYHDQDDFFQHSFQALYLQDYVAASYLDNIVAREQEYPTGLAAMGLNIAIPHTDPQHIKKPFIAITQLAKPLPFLVMGTTDEKIEVDWIFSLGVTQAENQIALLQTLMSLFSHHDRVQTLKALTSTEDVYAFFHSLS